MTTLKTLDEAVFLVMSVGYTTPLPELKAVADQLRAFSDSTELNFDDDYQLAGAMTGVASYILHHADRPRLIQAQIRKARKNTRRYALVF